MGLKYTKRAMTSYEVHRFFHGLEVSFFPDTFFIQLNYLIAANNNPPTATRARNGMSKYAQNTKINPAMSKKPKILIKPTPNLKKSQIKKIVNKSESIVSYLHNL